MPGFPALYVLLAFSRKKVGEADVKTIIIAKPLYFNVSPWAHRSSGFLSPSTITFCFSFSFNEASLQCSFSSASLAVLHVNVKMMAVLRRAGEGLTEAMELVSKKKAKDLE